MLRKALSRSASLAARSASRALLGAGEASAISGRPSIAAASTALLQKAFYNAVGGALWVGRV